MVPGEAAAAERAGWEDMLRAGRVAAAAPEDAFRTLGTFATPCWVESYNTNTPARS